MLVRLAQTNVAFTLRRSLSKVSYLHHLGDEPLRYLTVGQLLQKSAERFGDTEAVISRSQKKRITFREVLREADKLAAGLKSIGVEKNDRVGIWAPNLLEWYITKMASARGGFVLVALNPAYQPPEIEYCINKVGIKAMVCASKFKDIDYHESLASIAPELLKSDPGKLSSTRMPSLRQIVIIGEEERKGAFKYEEVLDRGADGAESIQKNQSRINPDDACNIQFTSGTTGKPKAAVVSHYHLVNNGYYIGKRNELSIKHHKICVQVPLFHAFGTTITVMAALNHGATLVLPSESYSPTKSLEAIEEEQCTVIHGTPTMYVDLVHVQEQKKANISPEIAISGGALCAPHLFAKMRDVLKLKKVKSVYGLTETVAVIFQSLSSDTLEHSLNTVGHLSEHLEAKVVDGNGHVVPIGTPGELCIKGYCNMLGYWGDEQKTKDMIGNDGWLKTGDQFVLQEDGYGKIVGRLKDMIIRGGENIFPKEIEDFFNTHPDILETQVIGLPHERLGEEVCACIRVKPGTTVTHKTLVEFSKGKLADFKIPSRVEVMDRFPTTASGKIQKFKLLQMVQGSK